MEDPDTITKYVTSRDGTQIGYICRGHGPGIVLVQGAMATAYNFEDLAKSLSHRFATYAIERRGRGLSPNTYNPEHSIARDVEDVDAILAETGASYVFGLSSGAMITLEAARTIPRVTKAAAFEPPFYAHGISHDGITLLNREIEQGHWASALATVLLTTETLPWFVQMIPKPILRVMAYMGLQVDDRMQGPYEKIRNLLPGIRYDFNDVGGMDGKIQTLATVEKPVLLLSGNKSAPFLLESVRNLKEVLPQAEHIEFDGVDHSGP